MILQETLIKDINKRLLELEHFQKYIQPTCERIHFFRKEKDSSLSKEFRYVQIEDIVRKEKDEIINFFSKPRNIQVQIVDSQTKQIEKSFFILVNFSIKYPVWVAQKNIPKNSVLQQKNFKKTWVNLISTNKYVQWQDQDLFDKYRTKKELSANEVLLKHHLYLPFVLKRGEIIDVVYDHNDIEITMKVKILKDARDGEETTAMIINTKKEIKIIKTGQSKVEALF